jgi:hypothetical protein
MALDFTLTRTDDLYGISCPQLPGWSCSARRNIPFKRHLAESLGEYLRTHGQILSTDITDEILGIIADGQVDHTRTAA